MKEHITLMPSDQDYLEVVESGDIVTARRIVDDTAEAAGYLKVLRAVPKGVQADEITHGSWVVPDNQIGHDYLLDYAGSDYMQNVQYAYVKREYLIDQGTGWAWEQTYTVGPEELNWDGTKNPDHAKTEGQIKSAEPIIYDNAGNPVPLSKRFDPSQD